MRKSKLSLIALFAMIAVIGMSWAMFTFTDPAKNSTNIGINLEGYTSSGQIKFTNIEYYFNNAVRGTSSLAIDNKDDISSHYVLVTVELSPEDDSEGFSGAIDLAGITQAATFKNVTLNDWLKIECEFSKVQDETGQLVEQAWKLKSGTTDVYTAQYKISLSWKDSGNKQPTNSVQWNSLNTALSNSTTITFAVEVPLV